MAHRSLSHSHPLSCADSKPSPLLGRLHYGTDPSSLAATIYRRRQSSLHKHKLVVYEASPLSAPFPESKPLSLCHSPYPPDPADIVIGIFNIFIIYISHFRHCPHREQ
ncbi:hypothetical protein BHE74_00029682 [Ensete ventricosum]|nr:hypothetical protein BHE74_00029682 [Ensete ventricosum]